MGTESVMEAMRATLKKLGWKNKPDGASKESLVFQVSGKILGFVERHQESGVPEVQAMVTVNEEVANSKQLQTLLGLWQFHLGDDEDVRWNIMSMTYSALPPMGGKTKVALRYILGEDLESCLAVIKDGQTLKGIADFMVTYIETVRMVDEARAKEG